MRAELEASFRAAVEGTDPYELTRAHLPEETPALVVCVGKAALPMARAAAEAFPDTPGLVVTRDGYGGEAGHFEVRESAHPVPDERSRAAADEVLARVGRLDAGDLVLLLVSGGGSALVCAPWGVSLEEKQAVNRALLRSGAPIGEMNAVRKHLSRFKGGQLARATEARIVTLILSDVPGDDLATVASGPTVPDPTTFADALAVIDRRGIDVPAARAHLERGARGEIEETPVEGDERLARVENTLIGGGWQLLEAAAAYWRGSQSAEVVVLSDSFGGEARELAAFHAELVRCIRAHGSPWSAPVVLLSGGEAAVTVRGEGAGGRNQEFLLALACALGDDGVWAIACDTDGIDGNTEAAGAVIGPDFVLRAAQAGLEPRRALHDNDAHAAFAATDGLVVTGPTRNNVNDYRAIVVTAD